MIVRVLLITDDTDVEQRLDRVFEALDVVVASAPHDAVLWNRAKALPADLLVIARNTLPDPIEQTVQAIQGLPEHPAVIVVTGIEDAPERARLLIAGCAAVLDLGLEDQTLHDAFTAFVARHRKTSVQRLQHSIDAPAPLLSDFESTSSMMSSFLGLVRRVVEPDSSLLIQGETGVGKERLARAIHAASPRRDGPFIPVILSAFPETLVEAELFGYEPGAFTGAAKARRGVFELAHGGTLFLDEIGELPRHLQVKLLRVIQERVIQRLGSEIPQPVDVRIVAATNRVLESETAAGRFRADLYYRLSVVTLDVPPLREHAEDVKGLVERYLEQFRMRLGRRVSSVSAVAMAALSRYAWPGNIRELINVVERAVLLCEGEQITLADLPRTIASTPVKGVSGPSSVFDAVGESAWRTLPWKAVRDTAVRVCERTYFEAQLAATDGNLEETARRAGINPRSLYDVLKRHGLKKEDYRGSA